jgi:hypothetical protein
MLHFSTYHSIVREAILQVFCVVSFFGVFVRGGNGLLHDFLVKA